MTFYIQPETVVLRSVLRGEGREREFFVNAVKVPNPSAPAHPTYKHPVVIHDPDDDLPDGKYELILGEQTFKFVKRNGEYVGVP